MRLSTLAIHGGQHRGPVHGAVMQPIVLASAFAQPEPGAPRRFDNSRSGNPTRAALEASLSALEGVESLAEHPALMMHAQIAADVRQQLGIGDGLVRLSVGLEDVDDLWDDLDRGLHAAQAA